MHLSAKKISPEIQKVFSLSSSLSTEDQIKFLHLLIAAKDGAGKKELIQRVLSGERVWEKGKTV